VLLLHGKATLLASTHYEAAPIAAPPKSASGDTQRLYIVIVDLLRSHRTTCSLFAGASAVGALTHARRTVAPAMPVGD